GGRTLPRWGLVLALCVAFLVVYDAVLVNLATGYFGGGFQTPYVQGKADLAAYVLGAALLDASFVLGVWTLAAFALRRCRGPFQLPCSGALLALLPPVVAGAIHYGLQTTFGRLIATSLLKVGTAGSSTSAAAMMLDEATPMNVAAVGVSLLASV